MLESAVLGAIEDDERDVLSRLRVLPRAVRFLLLLVPMIGVPLAMFMWMRRADYDVFPQGRMLGFTLLYLGVAMAAAWESLRPVWLPEAPRWVVRTLIAVALLGPVVNAAWTEAPTLPSIAATYRELPWAYVCAALGVVSGGMTLVLSRVLSRRGGRGRDETLLLAASAGLAGVLAGWLECPINFPMHLLLGHASVPALLIGLTLLSRRV